MRAAEPEEARPQQQPVGINTNTRPAVLKQHHALCRNMYAKGPNLTMHIYSMHTAPQKYPTAVLHVPWAIGGWEVYHTVHHMHDPAPIDCWSTL